MGRVETVFPFVSEHGCGALDLSGWSDCGAVSGICGVYEEVLSFA